MADLAAHLKCNVLPRIAMEWVLSFFVALRPPLAYDSDFANLLLKRLTQGAMLGNAAKLRINWAKLCTWNAQGRGYLPPVVGWCRLRIYCHCLKYWFTSGPYSFSGKGNDEGMGLGQS